MVREKNWVLIIKVFRLSPCLECSLCSFGNFPGVWSIKADVSELNVGSIVMEPTLSSETSAFILQTPGKFPKEHRLRLIIKGVFALVFMKRVFCKTEGYNKQTSKQITAEDTWSGLEIIEHNNEIRLLLIYGQCPCVPCDARSKTPIRETYVKTKMFSKRYGTKSRIRFHVARVTQGKLAKIC